MNIWFQLIAVIASGLAGVIIGFHIGSVREQRLALREMQRLHDELFSIAAECGIVKHD